jgi:hypothetical protein
MFDPHDPSDPLLNPYDDWVARFRRRIAERGVLPRVRGHGPYAPCELYWLDWCRPIVDVRITMEAVL